jgi:hypothetical protein
MGCCCCFYFMDDTGWTEIGVVESVLMLMYLMCSYVVGLFNVDVERVGAEATSMCYENVSADKNTS